MAWCRVLLPDVGSSSSHPLDPGQHYLFQALDVGHCVESEAMWKNKQRHITIACAPNLLHSRQKPETNKVHAQN